jgi:hypothetical protein
VLRPGFGRAFRCQRGFCVAGAANKKHQQQQAG